MLYAQVFICGGGQKTFMLKVTPSVTVAQLKLKIQQLNG